MEESLNLKELAKRVVMGDVFYSNIPEVIQTSFMVILALADPSQIPEDIGGMWEEYSKAGPRSMNGLPVFYSCHILTVDQSGELLGYIKELQEILDKFES